MSTEIFGGAIIREMADRIHKYPRTPHIAGSRIQPGDEDLRCISADELLGRELVVEEKLDGSNSGVSFDADGRLLLQSRGHFLDGGPRERQFALFKSWATSHSGELWEALGDRWVIYGEWLYAKHTIFYDALPHYFIEFDVLDKASGEFLSTARRRELLSGLPIVSAPILWMGQIKSAKQFDSLITASRFQTPHWLAALIEVCDARGIDHNRVRGETDASGLMEGLYLKVEDRDRIVERYKFVRPSYTQALEDSDNRWLERPIVPNRLRNDADIFAKQAKQAKQD
ncbi:MAG: RNA ligase family protein [Blastocatellia bacterium]